MPDFCRHCGHRAGGHYPSCGRPRPKVEAPADLEEFCAWAWETQPKVGGRALLAWIRQWFRENRGEAPKGPALGREAMNERGGG